MNIFVIHSGKDFSLVSQKLAQLKRDKYNLNALALKNGNCFWRLEAAEKIRKSQMVVFYIGETSHESPYIAWEIKKAIKEKKPIYTIRLKDSYQRHPALMSRDSYTGEAVAYDREVSEEQLRAIIKKYEAGDYELFNEPAENLDQGVLLEQYKIFLQTSEDLVSRRQNVNSFYISINSALIAVFSALFALDFSLLNKILMGILFAVIGIILSVSWIRILVAYGNLNASKMKIISKIEKRLPASLYDAEWAALSDKLNKKKYISFTENEKRIPKVFILVYSVILLFMGWGVLSFL